MAGQHTIPFLPGYVPTDINMNKVRSMSATMG